MLRQPWRLRAPWDRRLDWLLVGALLVPVAAFPAAGLPWAVTLLSLAQILPLLWRRQQPLAAYAVVALASLVQVIVLDEAIWGQVALPVVGYALARRAGTAWGLATVGIGVLGAALAAVDWLRGYGGEVSGSTFAAYFVPLSLIVVAAWALGTLSRVRSAYVEALLEHARQLERDSAQRAELAAAAERARIAREMHDVVAHGLTVMVVQADGARYAAAGDPAVAVATLDTIAATGREALQQMRRLLGLLRSGAVETAPQPGLAELGTLVEQARAAGTVVAAQLPDPGLAVPDGVALTAYRVVQEALTNVRKHAGPGARAWVDVRPLADRGESGVGVVDGRGVTVEVVDDGRGAAAVDDGQGHGLAGMRERIGVHAGALDAGPRPGGGFRVSARIPA